MIDLESTENQFNLLEEFNDQLIIRCRPFDSTIDRHSDSRPYTENRIILSDGTEMSASPIQLSENNVDFIATQAPFDHNLPVFWQMIAENKIRQIVMLTELSEIQDPQKELANLYWLDKIDETLILENELEITLLEKSDFFSDLQEKIEVRKFKIRSKETDQICIHYWYRNWLDNQAPREIDTILALAKFVVNDKENVGTTAPILVHCSAGIGRTGVFITIYYFMQKRPENLNKNLFHLVAFLRWQRPWMVATLPQYEFLKNLFKKVPQIDSQSSVKKS